MIHEENAVVAFMVKLTSFPIVAVVDCLIDNQIQAILLGFCCNRLCRGEGKQWWWVHGSRRGRSTCQDGTWPPLLHHHAPLAGTALVTRGRGAHGHHLLPTPLYYILSFYHTYHNSHNLLTCSGLFTLKSFFFCFLLFFPADQNTWPN